MQVSAAKFHLVQHLKDFLCGEEPTLPRGSWEDTLPALWQSGLGIVDIGARDGWHPMWSEVADFVHLVGFEPEQEAYQQLQARRTDSHRLRSVSYFPYGLSDTDGERVLHICRSKGVSSFYMPQREFIVRFPDASRFDIVSSHSIPVRSLDSLFSDQMPNMPPYVGFLKIDTQGSELDILRGARRALDEHVIGVEVEVEFSPVYESQPVFRHVDAYLVERGFSLFKLQRLHWVRGSSVVGIPPQVNAGQVIFGDALYLKDPYGVNAPKISTPQQAEALIVIALLYDLHDFALEISSHPVVEQLIQVHDVKRVILQRTQRLDSLQGWRETMRLIRGLRMVIKDWNTIKHWFPFMRQYPVTWARGDGDLYTRAVLLHDGRSHE